MLNEIDMTNLKELLERVIIEHPTLKIDELEAGGKLFSCIKRLIELKEYYISKKITTKKNPPSPRLRRAKEKNRNLILRN